MWGPYVAARQWGTVREDYSEDGNAWEYFGFDDAQHRAYRWGEDGLAGLCDRHGFLNLAVAVWNGRDDRLKERLFGLSNPQGNHGEDVKEYWWPLDATPTHSYARWLYRYPQVAYPYARLREAVPPHRQDLPEFELVDTGVLTGDRFFDVVVTHAKADVDDIVMCVEATNHGPEPADLHIVPQLWFRNTWAWGRDSRVLRLWLQSTSAGPTIVADHARLGRYVLSAQTGGEPLFCDNETNAELLFGAPNRSPFPKDGVDRAIVQGDRSAINPNLTGTKAAVHYRFADVPAGGTVSVRLRLRATAVPAETPVVHTPAETSVVDGLLGDGFDAVLNARQAEADAFYATVIGPDIPEQRAQVARRAFAGLLWGRQLYRYSVRQWLDGDPSSPPPPEQRRRPGARNVDWAHLALADVISMPDEWEYPWFASWDLAFHCVTLAHVDPEFAKSQLLLMCRAWAQQPSGQLPAYEWAFGDTNPPVHAWAAWQVYVADGARDIDFLVRVATKLLLNVGWWVNRQDPDGSNLFEGGFLGMDNISVFDRSREVPAGWRLEQSDATSWMAFYCLGLLRICQELARERPGWEDVATTLLERFLAIAQALESFGREQISLWDEDDGFFYDVLVNLEDSRHLTVRVRSMVGLLPLLAVSISPEWVEAELSEYRAAIDWRLQRHPELMEGLYLPRVSPADSGSAEPRWETLALVDPSRYARILTRLFDESEFLSPFGVRSMSAAYREAVDVDVPGRLSRLRYVPGESDSRMFGGNSNWRGPVWYPVNVLLIDALRDYARGAGADIRVEFPTHSGIFVSLAEAAARLRHRLVSLFDPDADGRRPGDPRHHPAGPLWSSHPTFSEYFDGDVGAGLGASHQTGWTALVAHLIVADD